MTGVPVPSPKAAAQARRVGPRVRRGAAIRHKTPDSHWTQLGRGEMTGAEAAGWACSASQMLQGCTEIALADRYTRGELASLRWVYLPGRRADGTVSPAARRNARHLNVNLGLLSEDPRAPGSRYCRRSFPDYISTIARSATIGWRTSAVEFDWEIRTRNGHREAIYWVRDFIDLPPQYHERFDYDPDVGLVAEYNTWTGQGRSYPATHLHVVTVGKEGTNLYGDGGLLYPCRADYNLGELYRRLTAVGGEKWALMSPIIRVNRKAAEDLGYEEDDVDDMIAQGYSALERYVGGDSNVLLANPAVNYETYGNPNFDPMKMLEVLRYTDGKKLRAYLLNLLAMGSSETGARNIGDHLRGAHRTLLIHLADTIAAAHSGPPRPGVASLMRCLDWSYGPQHPLDYPVLVHLGVREHPLADLLPHLPHMLNPALKTDRGGVSWMHSLLQLAQLDPNLNVQDGMRALAEPAPKPSGRTPRSVNLDPSAGGLPARVGL